MSRYIPLDAHRPIRSGLGASIAPARVSAPDADARLRELERAQAGTHMLALGTSVIVLMMLFFALRERQDD